MGKIVLLDELTINQIAAGEVIERPASVVKEMVENSIDAGATNITVEIKNGGISYIRVSDNGKGIARDDVEIAFERHATSKIRSAADLQEVKSMGFRGEALASIAAIANVELISRTEEQPTGEKVIAEGGEVLSVEEVACSVGTVITVRNLFYNTPVRYKFLKKDFTETGYIEDVMQRVALVHPEISIKLINSGKTILQTNGNGDLKSVVYSIYGREVAEEILPVTYEYEYVKVSGAIGKPAIARSNRANQVFFVNDRYIKDKTLTAAAEQAYKGMIPIGKFAFLILNLQMDPSKVDVNVHPAKLEVRFAEENVAFQAVYHAIKNTLLQSDLVSDREKNKEIKEASKDAFKIDYNTQSDGGIFGKGIKQDTAQEMKKEENKNVIMETDVFKRLKMLQNELQKQVDENPALKITDDYKAMTQKYDEIVENSKNIELKEENIINENTSNDNIPENNNINVMQEEQKESQEIIEETQVNQELHENEEPLTENEIVQNEEEKTTENINEKFKIENETPVEIPEQEEIQQDEIKEDAKIVENKANDEKVEEVKDQILSFEAMYKKLFGKEPYGGRLEVEKPKQKSEYELGEDDFSDNVSVFENMEEYQRPTYKFIGIAFKTYIILEMNQELYIMDQHAAHERILYEKVKANFFKEHQKESQMLLIPDIVTLTNKEMGVAKENFDLFEKAGFVVEEFGDNTLKISGVPEVCIDLDTKELFMETLDEINTVARTAKQEKEERFIATVACKAAVKANMALTEEEVNSLMNELLKLPNPFSCPHGRPTVIKMSKYDIERKFARK